MPLNLSHISLYSKEPQKLAHYFSELLDMDLRPDNSGNGIWVERQDLRLYVTQASATMVHSGGERDFILEFSTSTLNELEDLLQKVQFLRYRLKDEGEEKLGPKTQMSRVGTTSFFYLNDTDGRRWKFSYTE